MLLCSALLSGTVSTYVGGFYDGAYNDSAQGIPSFSCPIGMAVRTDPLTKSEHLVVADSQNDRLRLVDMKTGTVT